MSDWRVTYQDEYLGGRTFVFSEVETTEHEHCEFCWEKFMKGDTRKAHSTLDGYYVVCDKCYMDFKNEFTFKDFNMKEFENIKFSEILNRETMSVSEGQKVYEYYKVVRLLKNIASVKLKSEKLLITPIFVTYVFSKAPRIEYIMDFRREVEVSTADELLKEIFAFDTLNEEAKDENVKLCLELLAVEC